MNSNIEIATIETDAALSDILSNFSEDYLEDLIDRAFLYKFRPYDSRMPNYAYAFEMQYNGIKDNYCGPSPEIIDADREQTYRMMIDIICRNYNLTISNEIPSEACYPLAYTMCQIFLSEFTERLIGLFSNYIVNNVDSLLNAIPEEQKVIKSSYSKKVYTDPKQIILYENIITVLEVVAGLDFEMEDLLLKLSDSNTAGLICNYISDNGDLYKNHFASFIFNPITRSQMITAIKINFVNLTSDKLNITDESGNNIFIG